MTWSVYKVGEKFWFLWTKWYLIDDNKGVHWYGGWGRVIEGIGRVNMEDSFSTSCWHGQSLKGLYIYTNLCLLQ
jgi:hypothetical protein